MVKASKTGHDAVHHVNKKQKKHLALVSEAPCTTSCCQRFTKHNVVMSSIHVLEHSNMVHCYSNCDEWD